MRRTSNVALEIHTRERLKSLGRKGQTYDDIIIELLTQSGRDEIGKVSEINEGNPGPESHPKPGLVQASEEHIK
ncbi:MAG: DUF7557 family protein [Nitrososphaeraceae archaeon]